MTEADVDRMLTAQADEDVDRHHERARQRRAWVLKAPADFPFGERQYTAEDLGGHQSAIKALGEIALRVNNLQQMQRFYEHVLGLEVLGGTDAAVLLKIADGYGGHTQVLGLFDRSVSVSPEHSTVDHIALTIAVEDYEPERRRLEALGLEVEATEHQWVKWRSLYFHDPEGNQVELVCYDPSVGA